MHRALEKLEPMPKSYSCRWESFSFFSRKYHINALLKEMENIQNIAAASVLAKTYRDDLMLDLRS